MARSSIGVVVLLAALGFGAALVLDVGGLRSRLFADGPDRSVPPVAKLPPGAAAEKLGAAAEKLAAPAEKLAAPITPAWFLGASGYEGAELERQAARASMVIYFQRRRCDRCRRFERDVLGSAEVKAFLSEVVKVRIDAEEGDPDRKLAARFGVTGVPAVAVIPQRGPPRLIPERALGSPHQLIAFAR